MSEVADYLESPFRLKGILLNGFGSLIDMPEIVMSIDSEKFSVVKIHFLHVRDLNIVHGYNTVSENISIVVEDISSTHMEGIAFKVEVMDEVMTFYCREIVIEK